jgi:hypothetical protein
MWLNRSLNGEFGEDGPLTPVRSSTGAEPDDLRQSP